MTKERYALLLCAWTIFRILCLNALSTEPLGFSAVHISLTTHNSTISISVLALMRLVGTKVYF